MHAQPAVPDPISAARLLLNDAQREQRALESYRISDRPLSKSLFNQGFYDHCTTQSPL
jgi:tRNA A37 N6-isopentenylltransferase MiaA